MAYNTIKIKKYSDNVEELVAAAAITPGMLVEVTSGGEVQAHSSWSKNAMPKFALEDELQGKAIDEAYADGDRVQVWTPQRGDQVYGLLKDGEKVVIGDFLASNGDGYLTPFLGGSTDSRESAQDMPLEVVAMAREAVDRSDSSGGDTNTTGRIVVEVV